MSERMVELFEKRFPLFDSLPEEGFEFCSFLAPDGDMVVSPQEAGLELAVRCDPEPVTVGAELCVVERAHHFHLGTIKAGTFPVVHPARKDLT